MGLEFSELIERIASQTGVQLCVRGGLRLVAPKDVYRILEYCRNQQILILGIEAFRLTEDFTIPECDLIADYSSLYSLPWETACIDALCSAESYFSKAKDRVDLWFDFTLEQHG